MLMTDAMMIPIRPMNRIPPRLDRFRLVTAPKTAAAPNMPAAERNADATACVPPGSCITDQTITPIVRPIDAA